MKCRRVGERIIPAIGNGLLDGFVWNAFAGAAMTFLIVACDPSSDGCDCDGELDEDDVCIIADDALAGAQISDGSIWESAPWKGESWLCFNTGMKLRISHSLGYSPALVQVYLAFYNSDDGPDSPFPASGDLARIVEVTDAYVEIENNTEDYYFARVVLQ